MHNHERRQHEEKEEAQVSRALTHLSRPDDFEEHCPPTRHTVSARVHGAGTKVFHKCRLRSRTL